MTTRAARELRIAADEILEHGGYANDDVAGSQNGCPPEHPGDKSVDDLQALTDETRDRGDHPELKQAEPQLLHHHRKND